MTKVLVVDDTPDIARLMMRAVQAQGHEVSSAGSGRQALEILDSARPDVITLDIKMPGIDGIKFLESLKADYEDIPVIMCSAYGSYKQDFRVWASDAYVVKSADLEELKTTIKDILDK